MCEYNDDELVAPQWLNKQFFEEILKHIDKTDRETKLLLEADIKPASEKGDHYASLMFRVTIKYTETTTNMGGTKTIIIKTLPEDDSPKAHNLSESQLFANELKMYTQVIPLFEAEWQKYGENIKFAGNLLYASLSPRPVIVLEDLCLAGYDVLRGRLFNHNEVKACLGKLAKWHAVSYKLTSTATPQQESADNDDDDDSDAATDVTIPAIVTQMQHGLFKAKNLMCSDYISGGMHNMITALERAGGFEAYLPNLYAMMPHLIEHCVALNDAFVTDVNGPIYVLNHGDFHTKNIMFRKPHGNGLMADMLFIDFQMCFYGPSSYDLIYASFTLLDKQLRDTRRSELLRFYFQQFLESLEKLQFQGVWPKYEDFQKDNKRWCCFEIFLVSTFLQLTQLNSDKMPEVDINLIFNSAEYRSEFYNQPDYIAYLRELLPRYLNEGYLDI